MPVKNIECQIAEMQIGRHVSGEPLSEDALLQLETHLSKCLSCSRVLADRRNALRSMLQQGYAAVTTDVPTPHKTHLLIQALRDKAETATSKAPRQAVEADPQPQPYKKWSIDSFSKLTRESLTERTPNSNGHATHPANSTTKSYLKPLMYSAALAIVLFFMGYLSHGQNSLLGNSAANAYPDEAGTSPSNKNAVSPANSGAPNKNTPATEASNPAEKTDKPVQPKAADLLAAGPTVKTGQQPTEGAFKATDASQNTGHGAHTTSRMSDTSRHREKTKDTAQTVSSGAKITVRDHPITKRRERVRHHPASVRLIHPANRITIYDQSGNPLAG